MMITGLLIIMMMITGLLQARHHAQHPPCTGFARDSGVQIANCYINGLHRYFVLNETAEIKELYITVKTCTYQYVRVHTVSMNAYIHLICMVCTSTYHCVLVQPSYYQSTSPWLGMMEYILCMYSSTKSCYCTSRCKPSYTVLYCSISGV